MAKWFGAIGYGMMVETAPSSYREVIEERKYYGTLNRNVKRTETGEGLNDDVTVSNELSIVADQFAYQNFHCIRYVEFMGAKWKVTSVSVDAPRLILSFGGVYNAQQTGIG